MSNYDYEEYMMNCSESNHANGCTDCSNRNSCYYHERGMLEHEDHKRESYRKKYGSYPLFSNWIDKDEYD